MGLSTMPALTSTESMSSNSGTSSVRSQVCATQPKDASWENWQRNIFDSREADDVTQRSSSFFASPQKAKPQQKSASLTRRQNTLQSEMSTHTKTPGSFRKLRKSFSKKTGLSHVFSTP